MSCDYDNLIGFRDYVVNKDTGDKEPNPRSKEQIELRQQFLHVMIVISIFCI